VQQAKLSSNLSSSRQGEWESSPGHPDRAHFAVWVSWVNPKEAKSPGGTTEDQLRRMCERAMIMPFLLDITLPRLRLADHR
jgi:hypothetical protein